MLLDFQLTPCMLYKKQWHFLSEIIWCLRRSEKEMGPDIS